MVLRDQKDVQRVSSEGKKPYRKPELQVYGDLGSMTRTFTTGKNEDHGDGNHTADMT
jgi:hypothetical protein